MSAAVRMYLHKPQPSALPSGNISYVPLVIAQRSAPYRLLFGVFKLSMSRG